MATKRSTRSRPRKAATTTTSRASATPASATTARPAAAGAATGASTGTASAGSARAPSVGVRPPLEVALGDFMRELRIAIDSARTDLDAARAEIAQLRAELDALRKRYDKHSHTYAGVPGSGGFLWMSLGHLRHYLEDRDDTHLDTHGVWCRGNSNPSGNPPSTSGPSA